MLKRILSELKEHYPFTLFGALTGIVLMMLFKMEVILKLRATELLYDIQV